jgi:hypothetical protein
MIDLTPAHARSRRSRPGGARRPQHERALQSRTCRPSWYKGQAGGRARRRGWRARARHMFNKHPHGRAGLAERPPHSGARRPGPHPSGPRSHCTWTAAAAARPGAAPAAATAPTASSPQRTRPAARGPPSARPRRPRGTTRTPARWSGRRTAPGTRRLFRLASGVGYHVHALAVRKDLGTAGCGTCRAGPAPGARRGPQHRLRHWLRRHLGTAPGLRRLHAGTPAATRALCTHDDGGRGGP